jgi:hypothetical protein
MRNGEVMDTRTADERVEDIAFENRIKSLTRERKWHELHAVLMIYGSALAEREPGHITKDSDVVAGIVERTEN